MSGLGVHLFFYVCYDSTKFCNTDQYNKQYYHYYYYWLCKSWYLDTHFIPNNSDLVDWVTKQIKNVTLADISQDKRHLVNTEELSKTVKRTSWKYQK